MEMALIARLSHPDAVLPEMGKLRSCEDVQVGPLPTAVRTGVSVFVPHGMYASVYCGEGCSGGEVVSDKEIVVVLTGEHRVRKGHHIADLVFGFKTTVDATGVPGACTEGDASEMGPLA